MPKAEKSNWVLVLIGCEKLIKAAILIFAALMLHRLSDPGMRQTLEHVCRHIRVDPENEHIHTLIARLTGISPKMLRDLRVGSFIYAGLYVTEGTGLVLRMRWAEYFTAISTSLLLPLEIWEMFHGHHHVVKIFVILLNVAIVVYLVRQLIRNRK